ncbi:Uncharacterized protein YlaI [Lihuaxuella thermophila]|uniref:Uncharacterized protein YlaI n=2 Tax=Lihuaxuella thermophila TaxID=1173111 RepID=A0A1H8DKK7_9BACL|nr:Uncharacterized protein YlaI [Lihuaxuella thermophila]
MKVICILCDQAFKPDKRTEKKLRKHPHKIQLCPDCYQRITHQVIERQKKKGGASLPQTLSQTETNLHSND